MGCVSCLLQKKADVHGDNDSVHVPPDNIYSLMVLYLSRSVSDLLTSLDKRNLQPLIAQIGLFCSVVHVPVEQNTLGQKRELLYYKKKWNCLMETLNKQQLLVFSFSKYWSTAKKLG